jgi:16S rRNA processing protein RimM
VPAEGVVLRVRGDDRAIVRRGGLAGRPLLRLAGVSDRAAAADLRGEVLTARVTDAPLEDGEWLADDLVGCRIEGIGEVRRVIRAPSCDLLETGPDATLVPLVRDAIRSVDLERRRIEVDLHFLGLDSPGGGTGAGEPATEIAADAAGGGTHCAGAPTRASIPSGGPGRTQPRARPRRRGTA